MTLPLYPKFKKDLESWLMTIMKGAVREALGPIGEAPRFTQHEGDTHSYMTVDGDQRTTDYQNIGVEIEIDRSNIPNMSFEDILRLTVSKGRELGAQQAEYHYGVINNVIEESGNVVHAGGEPLTIDHLLGVIEQMQISFDPDGNPRIPSIIANPETGSRVKQILAEAEQDAEARARLQQIIENKRREWDEAESRRKLVD
jgi:hypothetical protein